MTVSAILKDHKDSLGRQRIYIRVTDGSKRKYFRTNLMVAQNDFEKGVVKSSHPQHKHFNHAIKLAILAKESDLLFNKQAKEDKDFYSYCNECVSEWEQTKRHSTIRQHWAEISKLKGFASSLKLSQITDHWLQSYSNYCYKLGNKTNTVHKTFKFIRMMIRKAHRERLIEINPFDLFKMPVYRDPQRIFLTREQVNEIEKFTKRELTPKELKFIGTWFLICCFTGLRYSDAHEFSKSKIKSGRLIIYTKKTYDIVSIPVDGRLKRYFELIDYKPLSLTNEYCNRMIKVIAECCEIEENVSWHTSRHTAATMMASAGIRQEVIARILGHSDLRSTSIYMKLTAPTIDAELAKMK